MRVACPWRARVAFALALLCVASARADVRAVSDAERAAVEIAIQYLGTGADAVLGRLSASSPIRAIPDALRATEVETRLGPPEGATWELITVVEALQNKTAAFDVTYASGIDETVFFDLVREGDQWRVQDVRITAMPVPGAPIFPPVAAASTDKSAARQVDLYAGLAGMLAAVLTFVAIFLIRVRGFAGRAMFLAAFVLGAAAVFVAVRNGERFRVTFPENAQSAKGEERRLSRLVALRNAIAAGGNDVGETLAGIPREPGYLSDVIRTWKAQWDFRQGKLDEVERALAEFPLPSRIPMVEILRARLALARNDSIGAAVAYERAVNLGPGRDALWLERTSALVHAGFDDEAKRELKRVAKLGSREAGIYYTTAAMATEPEDCELLLQRAWSLVPAERSRLVASGVLWSLVRRRGPTMIDLSAPQEATVLSPSVSTRAIALPPNAEAAVSGELLQVAVNGAEVFVPNGACLAPQGTQPVDAGRWSRKFDERALRIVPTLLTTPPPLASYMQPALRDRIANAAAALANRNRWQDVVTLTQSIATKSEFVPPELFFLRATALQHLDRDAEAKSLLVELAGSPVLERKRDATVLQRLGDMLASYDMYDLGIRMFERARAIRDDGYSELRVTQIGMDKRLATQYTIYKSPNFEIRYPSDVSIATAAGIAKVLEGELQRMQRWIPVPSFNPVVVNIVWWNDFTQVYTGSEDILGFYTGKITLPLAGISELHPAIVALITHELAHAMLAQATNDQAPHWIHEGLAQRMQMIPYSPNAFNMYEDDKLLAVSVLDAVLTTSRDSDMVGAAYIVSQTFVRYLEQRVGEAGMRALIAKFAAGATTAEAIEAVCGAPLADVDAAFRTWGRTEKRVFENPPPVRYDQGLVGAEEQPQKRQRGSMGKGTFYPFKRGEQQ